MQPQRQSRSRRTCRSIPSPQPPEPFRHTPLPSPFSPKLYTLGVLNLHRLRASFLLLACTLFSAATAVSQSPDATMPGRLVLVLPFENRSGDPSLNWIAGTGNWDTYRTAKVGEVTLEEGPGQLEVRSEGKIKGALIDLRAVELRPITSGAPCCEP